MSELSDLALEVEALVRWKAEAMDLLREWDDVAAMVETVSPTKLGHSRAANVHAFVRDAVAHYQAHCCRPSTS